MFNMFPGGVKTSLRGREVGKKCFTYVLLWESEKLWEYLLIQKMLFRSLFGALPVQDFGPLPLGSHAPPAPLA